MTSTAYRVIVTPRAFDDLNKILDGVTSTSAAHVVGQVDTLWESMQSLGTFPQRYVVVQGRSHPAGPVRRMPVPPYVVYYRTSESERVVRILTVLHGRRRRPRSFE